MPLFVTTSILDTELINSIAERIMSDPERSPYSHKMNAMIDLIITHTKACPLDLRGLLDADQPEFWADIIGVAQNLDRKTCTLKNQFQPRYDRR